MTPILPLLAPDLAPGALPTAAGRGLARAKFFPAVEGVAPGSQHLSP